VFEAVPNTWAFGIESVWAFEHQAFRFRRVPEGFESAFPLHPVTSRTSRWMKPFRTEAVLMDGGRVVDQQVFDGSDPRPAVRFTLPRHVASKPDLQVRLKFWVLYADSVYGRQILSPDGLELQGAEGLVRTIPVELEEPDRVVGLLPLPFWAFSTASAVGLGSQGAATWFWNVVVLLLACAVVIAVIWRVSTERDALAFVPD
jgi:hypothetical protein